MSVSVVRLFRRAAGMTSLVIVLLSGRIVDKTTGQPLVGVTVGVGTKTATTDAEGRYRLRDLRAGSVTLTLQSNDVPIERVNVVLKPGANTRDVRACSTTLDFGCGELHSSPAGAG